MSQKDAFETKTAHPMEQQPDAVIVDRPRISRRAFAIGAASLLAVGAGVQELIDHKIEYIEKFQPGTTYEDGRLDTSVKAIILMNGARLRSDPVVPGIYSDANILTTVDTPDEKEIRIKTPNGAYKTITYLGPWYGIRAQDLEGQFDTTSFSEDVDQIIWVNYETVTPVTKDIN